MTTCPHELLHVDQIRESLKALDYAFFDGKKALNLNIVGVRSSNVEANVFDDSMFLVWRDQKLNWRSLAFPMTTDPGTFHLLNPSRVEGTAILPAGQHRATWGLGLHKGKYEALVQKKPLRVWRDNTKDNKLDQKVLSEPGLYGINIHKAGSDSTVVSKWSAGCQVYRRSKDFDQMMRLYKASRKLYGDLVTYTLLSQSELLT